MLSNTMNTTGMSSLQSLQSNSTANSITHAAAASKSTASNTASSTAQTTNSAAYSVEISKSGTLRNAVSTASVSSANSISSAALAQYNDSQLRQMLSGGKITRSQYDMAIAGRKQASQQAKTAGATSAVTANTAAAK